MGDALAGTLGDPKQTFTTEPKRGVSHTTGIPTKTPPNQMNRGSANGNRIGNVGGLEGYQGSLRLEVTKPLGPRATTSRGKLPWMATVWRPLISWIL